MNTSNDNPAPGRPRRWFLALWPDEALRAAIESMLAGRLPARAGRRVARHNLHVTLVFLGELNETQRACVEQAAARCAGAPAFELFLDRLGWWRQSQVLWLGPSELPSGLDTLVTALRGRLGECSDLQLDPRPYRAHMTLMRKVRRRPPSLQIPPLVWRPGEFVLIESEPVEGGVRYHRHATWPLD